jgi:hypothetical protein
LTWK